MPPIVAAGRLPITRLVVTAYRDVWRVVLALRTLVVCAVLILLAVKVAEDFVPLRVWMRPIVGEPLGFVLGAVQSFLVTPFMIAVHRFIILDEVTPGYALDPSKPSFRLFFGWLVALSTVGSLVLWTYGLLTALGAPVMAAIVPTALVLVVAVIVSVRLTVLFPAIAVDLPGAQASNAWADTKGHAFGILVIFALALLPLLAISLATSFILGSKALDVGTPTLLVVSAVMHGATLTLCVAIASRVFQTLGDRMRRM
jgi:hypothetical protein